MWRWRSLDVRVLWLREAMRLRVRDGEVRTEEVRPGGWLRR